jgi:hypothetical protein
MTISSVYNVDCCTDISPNRSRLKSYRIETSRMFHGYTFCGPNSVLCGQTGKILHRELKETDARSEYCPYKLFFFFFFVISKPIIHY